MPLIIRCSRCGNVLYREEVVYERRYTRKGRYVGTEPKKVFFVPNKVLESLGTTATRVYCSDPTIIYSLKRCPFCGNEIRPRRVKISARDVPIEEHYQGGGRKHG